MNKWSPSKKALLFSTVISALKEQSAYFSLAAVKGALAEAGIELADDTCWYQASLIQP
ncbi:MAG TPA: hypothetical protein VK187_04455 [Geobacteraceae bacterium]|nr:hypothetical protein [Geobacteraceae bacterium]